MHPLHKDKYLLAIANIFNQHFVIMNSLRPCLHIETAPRPKTASEKRGVVRLFSLGYALF
jgi:hypothetical protein